MSRTYKTRPYWVKEMDKSYRGKLIKEYHNHEKSPCDIHLYDSTSRFNVRKPRHAGLVTSCGYGCAHYGEELFTRPKRLKSIINEITGGERAELRKDTQELKKLSREDIEEYDVVNPKHRHSGLWDLY